MKKENIILTIAGIITVITITILVVFNPFKKDIWDTNADKLKNSFNFISENAVIEDLSKFTPFKWDTLYSFAPYTPKEEVYKIIGYRWDNISEIINEGLNQIVFVKDGKVVCYLYGYPENNKLGFNFGKYEGSYIKLTSEQKLSFRITINEDGIRYLHYIK